MTNEIWKDISGYEGFYQINNFGSIKALARTVKSYKTTKGVRTDFLVNYKESILRPSINSAGYYQCVLSKNSKTKTFLIHILVAKAFIPLVEGKSLVNHKNGIRHQSNVDNLEWSNYNENRSHGIKDKKNLTGAHFHKKTGRWRSKININGLKINLGVFDTEIDAAEAYKSALVKYNFQNKYV